ncbi:MAG: hypothetical protein O6944_11355 [Gammaproteobacteria bacterium]|nr:hypothetical protein [Gammaproteobacteria bacterium]
MNSMPIAKKLLLLVSLWPVAVQAQDQAASETDMTDPADSAASAQANNPLASFTAFNLHNYYIPELSGPVEETANSFILRYAKPFGKWLMRASLPFNRTPTGITTTESGLGDLDVFFAYLFDTGNPGRSFGIGPQFVLPTATEDATGTGKYQIGLAAVYFDATSAQFQWGGLLTYRTDVGGDSDRADTSVFAAQPFYFIQMGGGYYLRGAPIWAFDLENNTYHIPIGLGLGKVFKSGSTVFNVFAEPQFTILHKGDGQPQFQLLVGFNMQFN